MSYPSPLQAKLEAYSLTIESRHEGIAREGAATGEFKSQLLCGFLPWGDDGCNVLATTGNAGGPVARAGTSAGTSSR